MIPFEKNADKPRELVPVGNHVARLYSIIEIGHVPDMFNDGLYSHKIRLTWELPEETREFDGLQKPMVIGAKYTISLYEKSNLRPIVEGMLGKLSEEDIENFNIQSLLGKPCMLQVAHQTSKTGREYAKVLNCAQVPKKLEVPAQVNPSVYLDYRDGWDQNVYENLPQFIKDDMAESKQMKERDVVSPEKDEINPADVPF